MDKKIADSFHIAYEQEKLYEKTTWLGVPIYKFPMDAFTIQELIVKVRPDFIIETGTAHGGSALFFASILELLDHGKVITVDIKESINDYAHFSQVPDKIKCRIEKMLGSSVSSDLFFEIEGICKRCNNMVILDSWHSKDHVLAELRLYTPLVSVGSYIIVEDTHVSGHPVPWKWGEGPFEAVQEFLKENADFIIDENCERLGVTYNPSGYLRRVK